MHHAHAQRYPALSLLVFVLHRFGSTLLNETARDSDYMGTFTLVSHEI